MAKATPKNRKDNVSQSAKRDREPLLLKEAQEERRFRDALEDDQVREALKLTHAHEDEPLTCDQS